MADVVLENVSKLFTENVIAVHEFSLPIRNGEFLVLLGPSGCGKTTILRLIAGLETVTEGKIYISGQDITDAPPRYRNIAMVFQNYALYPHMTAYENIAFGLRMRKEGKEEIDRLVNWAGELLGITQLLERRPKALSGGERQRIALGRALVRKPDVFLFDEPLSNLDAKLRVQMRHEILNLHRQIGTTAIYVTHDQFEAMTMGDRIAVLENGRLRQVAPPEELYHRPQSRFVAEFIGTPAINIIHGTYSRETDSFVCDSLAFPWPSHIPKPDGGAENEVDFGIRPEALSLAPLAGGIEVNGVVERIETLGGEHHLYLCSGKQCLVSRIGATIPESVERGKELKFYFNLKDAHFFKTETGNSLQTSD